MRAYPINEKGERIGEAKCFSAEQWAKMQQIKGLRWVVEDQPKKEKEVELIFKPRSIKPKSKKGGTKNEE
jgi:hypothetical protein